MDEIKLCNLCIYAADRYLPEYFFHKPHGTSLIVTLSSKTECSICSEAIFING